MVNLTLSLGKGVCVRNVTLNFLVISCRSAFEGILMRYFLAKLDLVVTPVHFKITYHDMEVNCYQLRP